MRTAVFIAPESLLNYQRLDEETEEFGGGTIFHLATHTVSAINRLKKAGFLIIGLGRNEVFHGFATQGSCSEFLSASALDDVIIPPTSENRQRCASAMIQAAAKWLLDLDRSFFIGRDDEDILEAQLTGCTPLRIASGSTQNGVTSTSNGLPEAVDKILALDFASDERF